MLHDVGMLVLATHQPDEFAALLSAADESRRTLYEVERDSHHVTHAEIGGYLLTLWGLPFRIVEAATYHHSPARLDDSILDVSAAVYIANQLVTAAQAAASGAPAPALDEDYIARLGVADRLDGWTALASEQVGTASTGAAS
jgi:HD-like signal output (HDOD) protein